MPEVLVLGPKHYATLMGYHAATFRELNVTFYFQTSIDEQHGANGANRLGRDLGPQLADTAKEPNHLQNPRRFKLVVLVNNLGAQADRYFSDRQVAKVQSVCNGNLLIHDEGAHGSLVAQIKKALANGKGGSQ